MSREERERYDAESPEGRRRREEALQSRREQALEEVRRLVCSGQPEAAFLMHRRVTQELPGWQLPEHDLLAMIQCFHRDKQWSASIPAMTEYVARCPEKAPLVRLKLAQILLSEENRPGKASKVLAKIDPSVLGARQREMLRRLQVKAERLRGRDTYELADDAE